MGSVPASSTNRHQPSTKGNNNKIIFRLNALMSVHNAYLDTDNPANNRDTLMTLGNYSRG